MGASLYGLRTSAFVYSGNSSKKSNIVLRIGKNWLQAVLQLDAPSVEQPPAAPVSFFGSLRPPLPI
jgi:hypothetical protein